jgi:DNA polymerase-3 subunit delta
MSVEKIIQSWKKKEFKPIYWFEGEEDYYIDHLIQFAEQNILSESEASFNLTVFYGKDADLTNVVNACKRHPMFSDFQVVILKEAQQMSSIEKLESYAENPLKTTIFIVGYKGKSYDKRTKLYKLLQKNAEILVSAKVKDDKIQEWILKHVHSIGYKVSSKAAILLQEQIGNDLSRIVSEIEKLIINCKGKNTLDEDDIEKYIGISKEYNVFELQAALATKNLSGALKIIKYFESNPKAGPIQMVLPALYSFFAKVYVAFAMASQSETLLKQHFYFNPVALQQGITAMKHYGYSGTEKIILLLNHYNLKSLGIGDSGSESSSLLKEMAVIIIMLEKS